MYKPVYICRIYFSSCTYIYIQAHPHAAIQYVSCEDSTVLASAYRRVEKYSVALSIPKLNS